MNVEAILSDLERQGNLRRLPADLPSGTLDFTSNDYLGINSRTDLRDEFIRSVCASSSRPSLSAVASRLLDSNASSARRLESRLTALYGCGREALLFNSGYHANTGIISAIASLPSVTVIADRLVHASIIDGITLSRTRFQRFRHNDFDHLERLISSVDPSVETILVIVESIYSMDGDRAALARLTDLRRRYPRVMLYVDEAHAFGVEGPAGLGMVQSLPDPAQVDILVGTLGKAAASVGAFAIVSPAMRRFLINRARSLIFSTALPPLNHEWTLFILDRIIRMDAERVRLRDLSLRLAAHISRATGSTSRPSHIQPVIVGDPVKAVLLSQSLDDLGIHVLPIRVPTVPAGTERLRISLSAAHTPADVDRLGNSLIQLFCQ